MRARIFAAMLFAPLLLPAVAQAEWSSAAGVDNYSREEALAGSPLALGKNSSRYALHLKWVEDGDTGLLYSYSGKLYSGQASYDTRTLTSYSPVTTQTDYNGMAHEGQLISRRYMGNYRLDYVGGLGWDSGRRTANMNQLEDYSVWFLRTGVSLDQPLQGAGFHGGGGLRLPLSINENASWGSAGLSSSPQLAPDKSVSLYAEFAYRTDNYWDIVGYYDSWRLRQPAPVEAYSGSSLYSIVQPQSGMNTLGLKAMYSF
jgi:hypothetical protein